LTTTFALQVTFGPARVGPAMTAEATLIAASGVGLRASRQPADVCVGSLLSQLDNLRGSWH
jgi:hypothetical protein